MKGVPGIIIRQKGGASKNKIKRSKAFVLTRLRNKEFAGAAKASSYLRRLLSDHRLVADYNITGPVNALMKMAQSGDTEPKRAPRNILLSSSASILDGFSFSKILSLESVIRTPLSFMLSRDSLSARIDIPALSQGLNFNPDGKYPLYSFAATLAIMPDFEYRHEQYRPFSKKYQGGEKATTISDWFYIKQGSPALQWVFKLPDEVPDTSFSLVLCFSIRFGMPQSADLIKQIKGVGTGKILATA
ncbi:MAG: hypothetical protein JST39_13125 [Bacteroidetes bacterium]|nr:hypothetical protein [Bacteroidota bacterium]